MVNTMLRKLLIFAASLLIVTQLHATTILTIGMDELAKNAEFVFEGKVLSKSVRPASTDGRPCTYFRFSVVDVIKGVYKKPEIDLCFTGGSLNGKTLRVSGMTMPTVGESGIYFVGMLGKEPTHPLLGWHQGHYLVKKDSAQVKRVVPAHPSPSAPAGSFRNKSQRIESSPDVETFKQMIRDRI